MERKREYAFDILRVISMIMVIVIHVSNVYSRSFGIISNKSFLFSLFYNTICRVSVPIFFMISGALLLDRSFNFKKYIKRLLKFVLLIIVWDVLYLVWEYYYLGITYDKLYKLLITPYRAHLWFLYTILLLYAIQPLLRIILNKSNKYIKVLLLFTWLILSTASMINMTIAKVFTIFSYIGFFVLGKYVYDYSKTKDLKKYNLLFIVFIIICFATSIFLNYSSSIRYNKFYNLYFAYRTPFIIFSSISMFLLALNNYKKDTLNKVIIKFSDLSLGVYLIHGIFLDVTVKMFLYPSVNALIGIPIFTFIIFICSITFVYIIKKIKILEKVI